MNDKDALSLDLYSAELDVWMENVSPNAMTLSSYFYCNDAIIV
jgi:hypothetical protein